MGNTIWYLRLDSHPSLRIFKAKSKCAEGRGIHLDASDSPVPLCIFPESVETVRVRVHYTGQKLSQAKIQANDALPSHVLASDIGIVFAVTDIGSGLLQFNPQ